MSENREEILANFQACTGIEDVGEAILHLEQTDWDLLSAINRAMPQFASAGTEESSPDVEMVAEIPMVTQNISDDDDEIIICNDLPEDGTQQIPANNANIIYGSLNSGPSTSQLKDKRRLRLIIEYKNQVIPVELYENQTVRDLKKRIMNCTDVPICQQNLLNWTKNPESDRCTLSSLGLDHDTRLKLIRCQEVILDNDEVLKRLQLIYTLNIKTENHEEYNLKFAGEKSILDVKNAVYTLTNIPVRHQVWTGWPPGVTDDSTLLACSGIDHPSHSFTISKSTESDRHEEKKKYKRIIKLDDSDDSSVEEFEDAAENFNVDDDMFMDDSRSRKLQALIPDMVEDETAGCLHFAEEFSNRYGALHPEFFPSTLDDAIKEACMKPAKDRRLLAVYLHHDNSVLSNVFCTQVLCSESIIECLTANFVVWGWDLTYEWNKLKFMGSLSKSLGHMAAHTIRSIPEERYPVIIIISRLRSTTEINAVIQGSVTVGELLTSLTEAIDVFSGQQKIEIAEEEARAAREMIMFEQDAAYRESLEMDRAKEEAKRQQEMVENEERQRVEKQQQKEAEKKEAYRLEIEGRLKSEPPPNTAEPVAKLKFRLPKGESLERRFFSSEPLQNVLDYLVVKGFPSTEFKVISCWPRKDLTEQDCSQTLQQLKLCPQETVIVEER